MTRHGAGTAPNGVDAADSTGPDVPGRPRPDQGHDEPGLHDRRVPPRRASVGRRRSRRARRRERRPATSARVPEGRVQRPQHADAARGPGHAVRSPGSTAARPTTVTRGVHERKGRRRVPGTTSARGCPHPPRAGNDGATGSVASPAPGESRRSAAASSRSIRATTSVARWSSASRPPHRRTSSRAGSSRWLGSPRRVRPRVGIRGAHPAIAQPGSRCG